MDLNKFLSSPNLIGVQTLALVGILYQTRTNRNVGLRQLRYEAYLTFASQVSVGWRIFEHHSYLDDDGRTMKKVIREYEDWLAEMDAYLAKFSLSSPNYVFSLGEKYYDDTDALYRLQIKEEVNTKISQDTLDKTYDQFHRWARFDLRHPNWSYVISILYFVNSIFARYFNKTSAGWLRIF